MTLKADCKISIRINCLGIVGAEDLLRFGDEFAVKRVGFILFVLLVQALRRLHDVCLCGAICHASMLGHCRFEYLTGLEVRTPATVVGRPGTAWPRVFVVSQVRSGAIGVSFELSNRTAASAA